VVQQDGVILSSSKTKFLLAFSVKLKRDGDTDSVKQQLQYVTGERGK